MYFCVFACSPLCTWWLLFFLVFLAFHSCPLESWVVVLILVWIIVVLLLFFLDASFFRFVFYGLSSRDQELCTNSFTWLLAHPSWVRGYRGERTVAQFERSIFLGFLLPIANQKSEKLLFRFLGLVIEVIACTWTDVPFFYGRCNRSLSHSSTSMDSRSRSSFGVVCYASLMLCSG
jgi:hypothetical protein